MPTTIPYDPQLALANIVTPKALVSIGEIADAQAKVDSSQDELNALLASRRSFDMTRTELLNLGIDTTDDLKATLDKLNIDIQTAAKDYINNKIAVEATIRPLRANMSKVHTKMESPVDYVKTQIKTMPLASDSINLDVQYFSRDTNEESSTAFAANIASYVSASVSWLGNSVATQMSAAAQAQVAEQAKKHSIEGTLVISVSCTHKNASVLAPFVLNVDKAIKVWNHLFPGDGERIDTSSTAKMLQACKQISNVDEKDTAKFSIISGMTYGSSFVGMVHVLNTSESNTTEKMTSIVASLQKQMDAGAWFAHASGGFGVSTSIANDVKNLISSQNISTHATMICMGAIPSLVANEVKLGVEKFADFDPKSTMESLATIQNATVADQDTVKQSADAARTGGQMVSLKAGEIKAALSALAEIDDGANKIIDINSMMNALDDYLKKAAEGSSGVPLNYYLKDITRDMLAEMWVAKYYPGKYLAITYDDEEKDKPEPGPST